MEAAGFTISGHDHPICPVMTMDAHKNQALGKLMADEGIFVIPFSFPVVASGKERIRVQISTTHTNEDIDRTVAAFIKGGKQLGIIS
jgi:glycine C-acetyltransferase